MQGYIYELFEEVMKLTEIHVQNYRGLRDTRIPLSEFACLIGRNNSGKSSFLQCLSLLVSGTKLKVSDFYDPAESIRIELTLEGISEVDLARVETDQHRERFAELIQDGQLRLVRKYEPMAGKSSLLVVRMIPADKRLDKDALQPVMKGKAGAQLRAAVLELIPELDDVLEEKPTQGAVLDALAGLVEKLGPGDLVESDEALTTGLPQSIIPLLPEIVYIPAVKDVTDEIKTTESATFGKLLNILFDQIEDQFQDLEDQFAELQKKLSRIEVDGVLTDNRLAQVQVIEATIQKFVQHNFPDVELKLDIPAPELRTILSKAEISVDDGYEGPVTSKGDGLKRAVAFAVLQAYAELKGKAREQSGTETTRRHPYVLLFEEPELYLHPAAQTQLFAALEAFSKDQTVIVTTHNPSFFSASSTKTFIKLSKESGAGDASPVTKAFPIDLTDMSARDQLQLIGHENNNAALFSDRVVLVEGDSDFIVFPHVAKLLVAADLLATSGLSFVRISGKGSLKRYRMFFERFGIPVFCVVDLDILTNQFKKLDPSDKALSLRAQLMDALDAANSTDGDAVEEVTSGDLRDVRKGGETRGLWDSCREARSTWEKDQSAESWSLFEEATAKFLERLEGPARYSQLIIPTDPDVARLKKELIEELRGQKTYVLSMGCLEDYFPGHLNSGEKVDSALKLCSACTTIEGLNGSTPHTAELELICTSFLDD
jgi:putative ATP-dependent endonuclease of OLD family